MSDPTAPWCKAVCRAADLPGRTAAKKAPETLPTQRCRGESASL